MVEKLVKLNWNWYFVRESENQTIMDESQLKNLSPQQKDELMRNVQAQVALANMQELLTVSKVDESIL